MVADRRREGQAVALVEDRLEHEDVGQVHTAVERIVHHEDIVGMDVVAIVAQHRFDGGRHRAEMARQREALRDQAPVAVGERRGEIHVVAQDARIGGAADGERHLVRDGEDGEDGVPEELEAEGIGPARALRFGRRACRSSAPAALYDCFHAPLPRSASMIVIARGASASRPWPPSIETRTRRGRMCEVELRKGSRRAAFPP